MNFEKFETDPDVLTSNPGVAVKSYLVHPVSQLVKSKLGA